MPEEIKEMGFGSLQFEWSGDVESTEGVEMGEIEMDSEKDTGAHK